MEPPTRSQVSENSKNAPKGPSASGLEGSQKHKNGNKSIIHDYCIETMEKGYKRCIWICIKKGKQWIAKDITIDDKGELGIPELRKEFCSWWKRYSFYSVVGVKAVVFRFAKFPNETNEISVFAKDFDYDSKKSGLQCQIDSLTIKENPEECLDTMGEFHADLHSCRNRFYDVYGKEHCAVENLYDLKLRQEVYEWLPERIDYYWENEIKKEQVDFLEKGMFVTQYNDLKWVAGSEARSPYGTIVNGFQLIDDWHIRYILGLIIASLFISACVVAVSTAILQSLEAGLTAGSYALAISALVLAALTFLSAIM